MANRLNVQNIYASDSDTTAALTISSTDGISAPGLVGMIAAFAMSTAPSGWLVCDGSTFSSDSYPELAAAIGDTWGTHSGTTYYLPDLEGAFLRGIGSGSINSRTKTGPTNVGDYQEDKFQGHRHTIRNFAWNSTSTSSEIVGQTGQPPLATDAASGSGVFDPKTDGTNGTPRTGDETRPFNAGVLYCIKF